MQTQAIIKSRRAAVRVGRASREQHLEAYKKSGLSSAEYCRQAGINAKTFSQWKIKAQKAPAFQEVIVAPWQVGAPFEIRFANGISIQVRAPEYLNGVAALIREAQQC